MWQANEATLIVDASGRVDRAEAGRNRVGEVKANEVAVGCPNLLTDDDREFRRRDLLRRERAVDALVIGDREMGQATADGRLYNSFGLGERIK